MLSQVQKRLSVDSIYNVPCFVCLSRKVVSEVDCKPEECSSLEFWLRRIR